MDALQYRLLKNLPMAVLVPEWLPEGVAVRDVQMETRGSGSPNYRIVFGDGHERELLVEGTTGGGIGDVFPGSQQDTCHHPLCGDITVEFYDQDSEEELEFRSHWLQWSEPEKDQAAFYGIAGGHIGHDNALRIIESLAPLK